MLEVFDSNYFCVKSHFEDDGVQSYLIFEPIFKYLKFFADSGTNYLSGLKSYQVKALNPLNH